MITIEGLAEKRDGQPTDDRRRRPFPMKPMDRGSMNEKRVLCIFQIDI